MAWDPQVAPDERVVVDVNLEPREGVHFGLLVSDRQVAFSRRKRGLVLSDPWETVRVDRADVARPTLTRKRGWFLRVVGVLLIAATASAVLAFMVGALERFHFSLLLGFALGGACFVGASNRWALRFVAGGKVVELVQPLSSSPELVATMAGALQTAGKELGAMPPVV